MKIVRFLGGLGNQMFQYAFYKALSQQFNDVKADVREFTDYTLHNGFELERIFPIRLKHASSLEINLLDHRNRTWKYRKLRRLLFVKGEYYEENPLFTYNGALFEDGLPRLYWGYWQHHAYVDRVAAELRKDFTFPPLKPSKNLDLYQKLEQEIHSVAIHVRRGDYLKDRDLGGIADLPYFERGIAFMKEQLGNPKFYVFSDDISWCRENLPLERSVFIDWNQGEESFRDMQLISLCKHAIISNSSFSWWGAWLNSNPAKKIIVPKKWVKSQELSNTEDMHPENWIKW